MLYCHILYFCVHATHVSVERQNGENLMFKREMNNLHDSYAFIVVKAELTAGHPLLKILSPLHSGYQAIT